MNKILTAILTTLLINISFVMGQATNGEKTLQGDNGINVSENRLPELLRDVKVLLSDAFIADVLSDTLEVIYNLNRIFDLLTEADQYGEMDDEDKDEFDRFEESLISLYTKRFTTLDKTDAALTAEQLRMDITSLSEPLEVEMGNTQFTVVEDRDGHIPFAAAFE